MPKILTRHRLRAHLGDHRSVLIAALRLQGHRAYGGIIFPNEASVVLHETVELVLVGNYRDVGFNPGARRDAAGPWAHLTQTP